MISTTPFHQRLADINESQLWGHWSGFLSAERYGTSAKHEYFAIRNSVGWFDTSPLYKYWIVGKDAERFLAGVLARDIRTCPVGMAQYTIWCDDRGFVIEDGVVFRYGDDEFLLTAAEPNLDYFADLAGDLHVEITEASRQYGALAVQGPRSRQLLASLSADVASLPYFGCVRTRVGDAPVMISRTGYTGDLGYEVWVESHQALQVLDAVIEAGRPLGGRAFGQQALLMTRIEAGLVLINVEFESSRLAFTDQQRTTPAELGLGWMFRDLDESRAFIGRDAIVAQRKNGTARWRSVALEVDWQDHDRVYAAAGLIAPKDETPVTADTMLYDHLGVRAGYATSFMYSPVLQRHIAMARVRPQYATPGTALDLELTVDHEYRTVVTRVARPPLFNPARKTA